MEARLKETMKPDTLCETNLEWPLYRGKVRDTYRLNEETLLVISTDRVSAFDVVLRQPIPQKGVILNRISAYWFKALSNVFPNHMLALASDVEMVEGLGLAPMLRNLDAAVRSRAMIVKKAERIDMECIVRGYLAGSAVSEYECNGTVNGIKLPTGLAEGSRLEEPIFTPSTKADSGHDEPLSHSEGEALVGNEIYDRLEKVSLAFFKEAAGIAEKHGLVLADTKFEFGFSNGELMIIDELLTPDSSRFWDIDDWRDGLYTPFDKQFLRNWLGRSGWDKSSSPPDLPREVIEQTLERYTEVFKRLCQSRSVDAVK